METPAPHRQHYLVTLALLTTAGISFALMQTLVIPALPFFQREFGTSASWVTWIATGFLLSSSVLTPILGKLGDAYGKERLLVISLGVFGLASLAAAFAWNLPSLILFRVLQGAGAAVFPLSFGIIRDEFPPEKVGVGIGTVSSVFGAGGGIGLVLSGVIIEHLNWHWLFLIGAVPVLAATVLIALFVPESPIKTQARPDYLGGATLSAALATLLIAISEGENWGWTSARTIALLAASALLFTAWVRIEGRVPEPLVDLRTFARREMAATNVTTLMIGFSMFASFILLPTFVSTRFGASPIEVGLYFVPSSVAMMFAGPLAGTLTGRIGPVIPLRFGIALAACGLGLLATVHDHEWNIYAWMTLMGTGIAFSFAALGSLVIQNSRPEETGVASGMNTIMRTVGGAFGAQIAAAVITANTPVGTLIPLEHGFTVAFAIGACGAVAALVPTLLLSARRPVALAAQRS
jgi:EmrB/QacA subfamily drug resistance transporter